MGLALKKKNGDYKASPKRTGTEIQHISPVAVILTSILLWILLKALAAEIEKNQAKLDQCQKFSQQYSAAVKVRAPS